MNYCIIPARSKSKRIKNKNILLIKKNRLFHMLLILLKKQNYLMK